MKSYWKSTQMGKHFLTENWELIKVHFGTTKDWLDSYNVPFQFQWGVELEFLFSIETLSRYTQLYIVAPPPSIFGTVLFTSQVYLTKILAGLSDWINRHWESRDKRKATRKNTCNQRYSSLRWWTWCRISGWRTFEIFMDWHVFLGSPARLQWEPY